jgi:hypothetical protein
MRISAGRFGWLMDIRRSAVFWVTFGVSLILVKSCGRVLVQNKLGRGHRDKVQQFMNIAGAK